MYFYYKASDESGSPESVADVSDGVVGGAISAALMLIIVVVCVIVVCVIQLCKKKTNANRK